MKERSFSGLSKFDVSEIDLFEDGREAFVWVKKFVSEYEDWPTPKILEENTGIELPEEVDKLDYIADKVRQRTLAKNIERDVRKVAELLETRRPDEALTVIREAASKRHGRKKSSVVSYRSSGEERWKEYKRIKEKGGLLGITTPWLTLNSMIQGWVNGTLNVIVGLTASGKCLVGDTLLMNPETGVLERLDKLVNEKKSRVYSLDLDKGSFDKCSPSEYLYNGEKECVRLVLKSGRIIECTEEHPFLTVDGWKKLSYLREGDSIATCGNVGFPEKTESVSYEECILVAGLLAEGCLTRENELTFTNEENDILREVGKAAISCGGGFYQRPSQKYSCSWTITPAKPVWSVLRKWKVPVGKSKDKEFPEKVFRLDKESLANFIGMFWSCDGSVQKNGLLTCGLASKKMVCQLRHLLLRFGIVCTYCERENKGAGCAEIQVLGKCVGRFRDIIPLHGNKKRKVKKLKSTEKAFMGPRGSRKLFEKIKRGMRAKGFTANDFALELKKKYTEIKGWGTRSILMFDDRYRLKSLRLAEKMLDTSFGYITSKDIFWDHVKSVESIGKRKVYDLSIPKNHCFLANDIVVHNSWLACINAEYFLKLEKKVLFVTMEMPVSRIARRMDAIKYKLPFKDLRDCDLPPADEDDWLEKLKKDSSGSGDILYADKKTVRTVADITALVEEHEPDVVIVDGGYRLEAPGKDSWEATNSVVKSLQITAEITDIPWIVTTQAGDSTETGRERKRGPKMRLWNVRYGKEWVIDPDVVIGLYQNEDLRLSRSSMMIPLKIRESTGEILLDNFKINWNLNTMDFSEIVEESRVDLGHEVGYD